MNKTIIIPVAAGIIGFVLGAAVWQVVSPRWVDRQVAEGLPPELVTREIATGSFRGSGDAHPAVGKVALYETVGGLLIIRFSEFQVTNGPDLKVYLVKAAHIEAAADVTASEWMSLGPLKGNIGEQNYVLPAASASGAFGSVVIWSEQFGVLYASADLARAS